MRVRLRLENPGVVFQERWTQISEILFTTSCESEHQQPAPKQGKTERMKTLTPDQMVNVPWAQSDWFAIWKHLAGLSEWIYE